MYAVCAARWKGALVAVKVIDHGRQDSSSAVDIARESSLATSVVHPNVVTFLTPFAECRAIFSAAQSVNMLVCRARPELHRLHVLASSSPDALRSSRTVLAPVTHATEAQSQPTAECYSHFTGLLLQITPCFSQPYNSIALHCPAESMQLKRRALIKERLSGQLTLSIYAYRSARTRLSQ